MAWARELYWQPTAEDGTTGSYQTLTFPDAVGIAAFEERPVRLRQGVAPAMGLPRFSNYGVARVITLEITKLSWVNHASTIQKLYTVDSALSLGAVCHFTLDRARRGAWCLRNSADSAYAVPAVGDVTIYRDYTAGAPENLFGASDPGGGSLTETDGTPADGSNGIVIETAQPEGHTHWSTISAITGGARSITLATAWPHAVSATRAYCRWSGFYPALTMAQESLDAPRLVRDGPMSWSWRASFLMSPQRVFDLFP